MTTMKKKLPRFARASSLTKTKMKKMKVTIQMLVSAL